MVVAINMRRRRTAKKTGKLDGLRTVRLGKLPPKGGVIHELRVAVTPEIT